KRAAQLAPIATMPEVAIAKDNHPLRAKDDVRVTPERGNVCPVPVPAAPQDAAKESFSASAHSGVRPHYTRCGRGCRLESDIRRRASGTHAAQGEVIRLWTSSTDR